MAEWQPIETAPRDNTPVLLFGSGWAHPTIARWNFTRIREEIRSGPFGLIKRYALKQSKQQTWVWGGDSLNMIPTHWMPLPDPPERS